MSQNVQARVGVPIEHILPIKHIVPICLPEEARIGMKARCRDADWLPKVPQAGALVPAEDGGLFARQAARRYPAITSILCVEPEPGNFAALRYNLAGLAVGHARLWTTALASQDGTAAFMRDRGHFGTYSLNEAAMRDRPFGTISVTCTATQAWMRAHVPPPDGRGLLWKSGTQGLDEPIVSLTAEDSWPRVEVAVIELWRIAKPDFDRDACLARIAPFAGKSLGPGGTVSTAEVAGFLQRADGSHADLSLWRG